MSLNKQHGFSMIEVMVALVVLVFGVLGMAGLQMQAINATEQGRYNGRAAMQATSIAAAIKANPAYWGTPPSSVTVQGTTLTGGPTVFNGSCVSGTICTGEQMAYYDLTTWGSDIAASLPVGTLNIACNLTVSPAVCAVTISWMEKNVAGRNQATAGTGPLATGTVSTHSYQTLVSSL